MEMIDVKIRFIEQRLLNSEFNNSEKEVAIQRFKTWIREIDFGAEYVPLVSVSRLKRLFMRIKGSNLTLFEDELVHELVAITKPNKGAFTLK